jgi:hypothetical protein
MSWDRPLTVHIREEVLKNFIPADHALVEEEITATYGQHSLVSQHCVSGGDFAGL